MWILIILLVVVAISVVIFKLLLKSKKENPVNVYEEEPSAFLDIKMKSNIIKESTEPENKQLKRPLKPRVNTEEKIDDIVSVAPPKTEIKEEEKKVEAKNEVLDLDDLFKTISITTDGEDENFDFGLRNKDD